MPADKQILIMDIKLCYSTFSAIIQLNVLHKKISARLTDFIMDSSTSVSTWSFCDTLTRSMPNLTIVFLNRHMS